VLTVLIWDWDLIGIRSSKIGIRFSDLGLGFRFRSWDLGFEFQRFEVLEKRLGFEICPSLGVPIRE